MGTGLNIATHILLLGTLAAFMGLLLHAIFEKTDRTERLLRALALFTGAMVIVVARAAGADYATVIVNSLSSTRPGAALAKALSFVLPGSVGVGLGWYITHSTRRSQRLAMRVLALVGMLAAVGFATIYVKATERHGVHLDAAAIPNLSFVIGISLWFIFKHGLDSDEPKSGGRSQRWSERFRTLGKSNATATQATKKGSDGAGHRNPSTGVSTEGG